MEINTQIINMDVMIPEHIIKNNDGSYTILLNARLSHERQLEAYRHALKHILNRDFEKNDVDKIESDAHSA